MKNKELYIKAIFWALWSVLVFICVFFIICNAQWLLGDDYMVIQHTGFGKPFLPTDTVNPSSGRFYPFAYLVYDILLLFGGEQISPTAHYVLQAVFFIIFVVSATILILKVLEKQKTIWRYSIAFFVITIFIGRVYQQYTECFSTIWFDYSLLLMFMLSTLLFYNTQKWIYGIVALVVVNYLCYCLESAFVLPLSFGFCSLLFQRKALTSREKVFNWCLVGSAFLFLALYVVFIMPFIESAYDGSHGTDVGFVGNAVRMLLAQKLLMLAFVLFVVRIVDIVRNNKPYTIYDNLLLTAVACCCGNFILKLNWTLYYNVSALLLLPSIIHFSIVYLKEKWTIVLVVLLALFYMRKIPSTIQQNQLGRKEIYSQMISLSNAIKDENIVFWYSPQAPDSFETYLRDWKHAYLCTYLGWLRHNESFSIMKVDEFQKQTNSIWLCPSENCELFPEDTQLLDSGDKVFDAGGIQGFYINDADK